jgi:hypothetical protein
VKGTFYTDSCHMGAMCSELFSQVGYVRKAGGDSNRLGIDIA